MVIIFFSRRGMNMFFGEIEIRANIGFKPTACLLRLDSISLNDIEEERNIDPESGKYLFHILYYGGERRYYKLYENIRSTTR